MRLLLDTHIALWAVEGATKLGERARALIASRENDVFVSVVSVWEIAIKHPLQRGSVNDMPISGRTAADLFQRAGYAVLPVSVTHVTAMDTLPRLHGDPFDRMLVAQAITEPMQLLTRDARLTAYGAPVMLA